MSNTSFPLSELSIRALYGSQLAVTYEIPIYQRNYAWEEDQIRALVQDVYDAMTATPPSAAYFIGTLVTFDRGEGVYEVIDGQQRLTTIYLILRALELSPKSRLTYRARQKSKDTLAHLGEEGDLEDMDTGIVEGYSFADKAIREIVGSERNAFTDYFLDHVHIVHYRVPKDVDLNHYFEVMNSRGEQLERHEIVKAMMCNRLRPEDVEKFSRVWEACSNMDCYVQQKYAERRVFGDDLSQYPEVEFDDLPDAVEREQRDGESVEAEGDEEGKRSIADLLKPDSVQSVGDGGDELDNKFEPIIDFSNFLLIVLKLTRMSEPDFVPTAVTLDDKELLRAFRRLPVDEEFVKMFATNLLKAKYLLDNYVVHHSLEREKDWQNPWQLERYVKGATGGCTRALVRDRGVQEELVQLLSMFEVTFSSHNRKNYLFYSLYYLLHHRAPQDYLNFLRTMADNYFRKVYLCPERLNGINNRPKPNSFDQAILPKLFPDDAVQTDHPDFVAVYGDGSEACRGIQLYVFNYTDYRLWRKYTEEIRGRGYTVHDAARRRFFDELGCSDFGFSVFRDFYFSRSRASLEHYYPRSKAGKGRRLSTAEINCFGNYAMISLTANSSGSNWDPKTKLDHYLDTKYKRIGVASLKFRIMMQMCIDNVRRGDRRAGEEWNFSDICAHQAKMLSIIL